MFRLLFYSLLLFLSLLPVSITATGFTSSGPLPGIYPCRSGLWSVYENPAGLSSVNSFRAGTFYKSLFALSELSDAGFAAAIPVFDKTVSAIGYRRFGYSLYRLELVTVGCSKKFCDRIKAGLSFDWNRLTIGYSYGSSNTISFKAGFIYDLSDQVQFGFAVLNPHRSKISRSNSNRYPAIMKAGLNIAFSNHAFIRVGVEKSNDMEPVYNAGTEYNLSDKFMLMAGFGNGADAFYFGYNFKLGKYRIGMHSGYHNLLGFSPVFNITYNK